MTEKSGVQDMANWLFGWG